MPSFTDQTGNTINLDHLPKRIVSLVPSQTELLYALGLEAEVVGITKFCVHPDHWFRTKKRIGGTKNIHIDQVLSLKPDLVIAGKEENVPEQVYALAAQVPVWTSDIANLEDALAMIREIGHLTGKNREALNICGNIDSGFSRLKKISPPVSAVYLIWKDPYMTAGGDTFIHDMMERCGLRNQFASSKRYPATTIAGLKEMGCQMVLLSSEPYPFGEKEMAELKMFLPDANIELVNGEYFSWYGSRLQKAPEYFEQLQARFAR